MGTDFGSDVRLCHRQSSLEGYQAPLQTEGQLDYYFTPCINPNSPTAELEKSKDVSGNVDGQKYGGDFPQTSDPGYQWHSQVSQINPRFVEGSRQKRKLSELNSGTQDLVYPHTSSMGVQGAQLYHSGGVA